MKKLYLSLFVVFLLCLTSAHAGSQARGGVINGQQLYDLSNSVVIQLQQRRLFSFDGSVFIDLDVRQLLDSEGRVMLSILNSEIFLRGNEMTLLGLPTADPAITGRLWNDAGVVKVSP